MSVFEMDTEFQSSEIQLLHLDITLDEHDPQTGILDLLGKLRPEWKTELIQMKVMMKSIFTGFVYNLCQFSYLFASRSVADDRK